MKVVIFACEDVSIEDTLRKIKVEIVGPYLAYKREYTDYLSILDLENEKELDPICLANKFGPSDEDKKFVNFFRLPKTSF